MPRARGKLKLRWILDKAARRSTFRKRRATLVEKAQELAGLCEVPVAVVVYGPGEPEPTVWPSMPEAKAIAQRYVDLPDAFKERTALDDEGFMRNRLEKLARKVENAKMENRDREICIFLGGVTRVRKVEDPELAADALEVMEMRMKAVADRIQSLSSEGALAALPPPPPEDELVAASQEAPMVSPLAMAPLALPPPPEAELVAAAQEAPMVPPLAMAPMVVDVDARAPPELPAVEEPRAAGAGAGVNAAMNLDGEPRNGSFLLEMADAIMDDGNGVQATADDVDRLLMEHGLFNFKPM